MSGPVYSTQLAAQANYLGTLEVLVPTGFILVVRDIDVFWAGGSTSRQFAFFGNISNALWFWDPADGTNGFAQWRGRQVFETGQKFEIVAAATGSGGANFQVSGYKLTLP